MVFRELRFEQAYLGVPVPITEPPASLVEGYASELTEGEQVRPTDREEEWAYDFADGVTNWLKHVEREKWILILTIC